MQRILSALLVLSFFLIPAHCAAEDDVCQAFQDKLVEQMFILEEAKAANSPEVAPSSITGCIEQVVDSYKCGSETFEGEFSSCVIFSLGPDFLLSGPGGKDPLLAKFFHPKHGTWSINELWGIYGDVLQYVHAHSVELLCDGLKLSTEGAGTTALIAIYTEAHQYITFYDLLTGDITMTILDN